MFKILIVEDNDDMREIFNNILTKSGYTCALATNGLEAWEIIQNNYIDLMIVDIMMPKMDGYELTKLVREFNPSIPILMVTAKDQLKDIEKGFLSGTDDYMIKPVHLNELTLRVSALLRRAKIASEKKIVIGQTIVDYDSLTLTIHDKEEVLPQKEFYLLYKLLSYPNKIFTRQQLMDEIWGIFSESDTRTVNTHINRLRERLKECHDFEIITIRGLGYKAVKK